MRDSSGIRRTVGTGREVQRRNYGTRLAMVLLAALWVTACAPADAPRDPDARTWIRNMWTGPAVLPQTEARALPEGSMAVDAPRIMNRREARTALTNPLAETPAVLAEGEALYDVYCALCHGDDGNGDGELARHYRRMPTLTARHVPELSGRLRLQHHPRGGPQHAALRRRAERRRALGAGTLSGHAGLSGAGTAGGIAVNGVSLAAAAADPLLAPGTRRFLLGLAVLGGLAFLVGLAVDGTRAWQALLVNFLFFGGLAQAGVVLSCILQVTSARWGRPLKRVAEASVAFLPVAARPPARPARRDRGVGAVGRAPGRGQDALAEHPVLRDPGAVGVRPAGRLQPALCLPLAAAGHRDVARIRGAARHGCRGTAHRRLAGHRRRARDRTAPAEPVGGSGAGGLRLGVHPDRVRLRHGARSALVLDPAGRLLLHREPADRPGIPRLRDRHRTPAPRDRGLRRAPPVCTTSASCSSDSASSGPTCSGRSTW